MTMLEHIRPILVSDIHLYPVHTLPEGKNYEVATLCLEVRLTPNDWLGNFVPIGNFLGHPRFEPETISPNHFVLTAGLILILGRDDIVFYAI